MAGQGEFDFIADRLAPLAAGFKGALGLTDDAALLAVTPGHELVITADTLVEGRHFPAGTDPALAARKALRANLSDLAAMAARPVAYMTSIVWPAMADDALRHGFANGLAEDQGVFGVHLIGGDTTSSQGPWTISITAFGEVPAGRAVTRSGAKAGDLLVVTGTVGDAGLGLKVATGVYAPDGTDGAFLLDRLNLPVPRLALADALRSHAHAAIDVSDGLIADCRHVAKASGLALRLDLDSLPLSGPARHWLNGQPDPKTARLYLASAGDDYELACAVLPSRLDAFVRTAAAAGVAATVVGRFETGSGVTVMASGCEIDAGAGGFTHF